MKELLKIKTRHVPSIPPLVEDISEARTALMTMATMKGNRDAKIKVRVTEGSKSKQHQKPTARSGVTSTPQ